MTSIDSSKISRLMRSCSADISLSPLATTVPERPRLAWHGAAADAELHPPAGEDVGEGEVLGQAQRVPLRHDVEHLPEAQLAWSAWPGAGRTWIRFGSTS